MPFLYEFRLNGTKLNGIEVGFNHARKWEEALDDIKVSLPFYESESPLSQYGLLVVTIVEVDNYTDLNEIQNEVLEMIVISDQVSLTSQYGIYRHDISAVEYTAKLDAYIMASLAKTRDVENNIQAKFEISDYALLFTFCEPTSGARTLEVYSVFKMPEFVPNEKYYSNKTYTFSQVVKTDLLVEPDSTYNYLGELVTMPTVFRIYNETLGTYSSWYDISADDVDITFPNTGSYQIEYGFQATQQFYVNSPNPLQTPQYYPAGYYKIFTFYIKAIDEYQQTVYDAIMSVRQNVSKGGGIESAYYFDDTRIFDIDSSYLTYLKSIQIPQMYLSQATARQMLIFILSYINALPRLEYGSGLDNLTIEKFNLSQGSYTRKDVFEQSGSQNTNQIGTRSYAPLNQALPNNMDEPNAYTPSQDGWQQLRAENLQITDNSFAIKLPKEIYTPKEFYINFENIYIYVENGSGTITDSLTVLNTPIPMIQRLINIDEWKLKYITDNFPTIDSYSIWSDNIGLRNNMIDNLYWELGATMIKVSDVYGSITNRTLFQNVIKISYFEYLMLRMQTMFTTNIGYEAGYYTTNYTNGTLFLEDTSEYKDLRFRLAYLTNENLVTKQDKEDLTQIDFYSEMRQNQDESIINAVRSSRKNYGNLQRTGNKTFSFQKLHHSLSEQYAIGTKDSNEYTITMINRQFYARYFLAEYFVTKYHNRESRQTIVDQTYRWRDNYAKSVLDRHEYYSDYITLYPPDFILAPEQHTKLSASYIINPIMFAMLLGKNLLNLETRASVAMIRTDGMFNSVPENYGSRYGILTPVSAYPLKNGLAFTFGFKNNQVAGDGLYQRGSNWYNQAVRYTDEQGRFTKLGFTIFPKFALDSNDYDTFPKVTSTTEYGLILNKIIYFSCGLITDLNSAGEDYLIVDKDPLTNYNMTYQLGFNSYYSNLYIFGQLFFDSNLLVNNPDSALVTTYLYLYKDGTVYEMFDDLFVKDGYDSYLQLNSSRIRLYANVRIEFIGDVDLTDVTSWAIGNADGELYIACNEGLNGFKIVPEHFRLPVKEIGNKVIFYELDDDPLHPTIDLVFIDYSRISATFEYHYSELVECDFRDTDSITCEFIYTESQLLSLPFRDTDVMSVSTIERDLTIAPTVAFVGWTGPVTGNYAYEFLITNNDESTAEILAGASNPPTTDRGDIASGSSVTVYIITSASSAICYATAQASGESKSEVSSDEGAIS